MRPVRNFALAVFAAGVSLALGGAATSSATVLCTVPVSEGCATANFDYNTGTKLVAASESELIFTDEGGLQSNKCKSSALEVETTNTGGEGEAVKAAVGKLTFETCTSTTKVPAYGTLEFTWIPATNHGIISGQKTKITISIAGADCVYVTEGELGTLTGGGTATIDLQGSLKRVEGPFTCPAKLVWSGKYTVSSPSPLYVSKR